MKKLVMMFLIATLTACGGGSGDGGGDFTGGGGELGNIVGVWNASYDFGVDGVDEVFIVIDTDGEVTEYDYAGDSYTNGGNCYWIDVVDHLEAEGNNKYDSEVAGELQITVSGNVMTISGVDDGDEFSTNYVRSSREVSSFTPECTGSFADDRALILSKKTERLYLYKSQYQ